MKEQKSRNLPIRLLISVVILTTFTTAYFGYLSFKSSKNMMEFVRRRIEIESLQGQIMHLDEVLTMSARMGAATGNGEWEKRYDQNDPILDTALKQLIKIAPGIDERKSTETTDQANRKLVAMERRSFELVRKGRSTDASRILFGPEYLRQKDIYASGMKLLNSKIDVGMDLEERAHRRNIRLSFFTSILLFVLSAAGWLLVIVQIKRWGQEISGLNESLRIESETARRASQAKSAFLANMSHELRTPMHGILSFAKFGQQKFETAPKEKLKTYFDDIHDSGKRLMRLLNDLLDLSKLEAGRVEYDKREADLLDAINVVRSEVVMLVEEKGLKIETVSKSERVSGVFDREKMMQVVRNLISNAIKFSEKGTTIVVQLERTHEKILCSVVNQGVRIPAAELESIFDKFVQSSKTRTGAGGTGLGLAICKEIVLHHEGRIWAESKPGGETTFVVELPVSPSAGSRHAS